MSETDLPTPADAIARCRITLRRLVVIEILLTIAVVVVSFVEIPFLPPLLQEFQRQTLDTFGIKELALLCLAIPLFILVIVAWIALWRGWRSGRVLYTIVWLSTVPIYLLSGPSVQSAIHSIVDTATSFVGGIIIGFLYFSEIRQVYETPQVA